MMKLASGIVGMAMAMAACSGSLWAQTTAAPAKTAPEASHRDADLYPVETIFLANTMAGNDSVELLNAIRNALPPWAKIYLASGQNAIVLRAAPEDVAMAKKLVQDLDQPKKLYRLTFTITEIEGGKKTSAQHFSLVAEDGQRVTLKQGSKVPIATGSSTATGTSGVQTQFQYLDVGMNFDATLTSVAGGGVLKSKVEQTSVAEATTIADVREPIIRQAAVEGTSVLTLGKPLMLGSIDVTGSTRHLDVEVMMELVK